MTTHYDTLGIPKNASEEDIKKSYRKLVLIHHPDKGGDEDEFKKIKDAYDVLINPESRNMYDNPRPPNFFQMHPGFHQNQMNIFNMMNQMFTNISITPMTHPRINPNGQDVIHCISLSKKDFVDEQGKEKTYESYLDIKITSTCFDCVEKCSACNGQGFIQLHQKIGFIATISTNVCDFCQGKGERSKGCDKCSNGNIVNNHKLLFHVPFSDYNLEGRKYYIQYPNLGEQPKKREGNPGKFFIQITFTE